MKNEKHEEKKKKEEKNVQMTTRRTTEKRIVNTWMNFPQDLVSFLLYNTEQRGGGEREARDPRQRLCSRRENEQDRKH
jgi:hypothetical protein